MSLDDLRNRISKMGTQAFRAEMAQVLSAWEKDRKENAILHYQPVSDMARQIHLSKAQTLGVGGGNGSSKTEGCLAEMVMCATGQIPTSLLFDPHNKKHVKLGKPHFVDPLEKLRGPIACRVVCESLTTVLHPIILPKLQWWKWTGVDAPGGEKGHWGWIPRDCLIGGSWDKSWREKYRTLTLLYRDPDRGNRVVGESTIQFMSRDQDASDFASGDFHMVLHDEPPTYAIWRENQARTMRVSGRMMLAMTWPDDPSMPVDWLFDEVYEPATASNKNENIDWINLFTTDNPYLNQDAIAIQMENWSDEVKNVRIFGRPIRFSNRVHELFTDQPQTWCFPCGRTTIPLDGKCGQCSSSTITEFNHVGDCPPEPNWPTVWLIDPHPRKPHMFAWWQVTPQDDLVQVAEGECDGDPADVKLVCDEIENNLGITVSRRYIDPNMGRSPSGARRELTWQDEFEMAGLRCDAPNEFVAPGAVEVGTKRINVLMRPDPHTLTPRIHISRRCPLTIHQIKRYVWDDHRKTLEKAQKQTAKNKNDDFPTLMRYLALSDPSFNGLLLGDQRIRRMPPASRRPQRSAVRI
jgi:hypothetical protein